MYYPFPYSDKIRIVNEEETPNSQQQQQYACMLATLCFQYQFLHGWQQSILLLQVKITKFGGIHMIAR